MCGRVVPHIRLLVPLWGGRKPLFGLDQTRLAPGLWQEGSHDTSIGQKWGSAIILNLKGHGNKS